MSHARELGIRHLWTTEHDTRMGKKKRDIPFFLFTQKDLIIPLANGANAGFAEDEGNSGSYAFLDEENGISLQLCTEKGQKESMRFQSSDKAHSDSLLSRLTVSLDADIYLYGHGFTGETRTPNDNERNGRLYFNGMWGASLHVFEEDKHLVIPKTYL
jgi:hypothetical protein